MTAKKRSFIKDAAFYADAEDLQEGWGKRLRSIDLLKDMIQYRKNISINEYCYTLYGDGYCSHCWESFKMYVKRELKYGNKKLLYECWKGLFTPWVTEEYDRNKIYV